MHGTINWIKCEDQVPPLSQDPVWEQRKQSDKLLLYNINTRIICDGYWMGEFEKYCTSKGSCQPTHWAYINYPTK